MIYRLALRMIQLKAYAAFHELVLFVENNLRRNITALRRMEQIDAQRCATMLPWHVRRPLYLVQPAIVAGHQPIFSQFFRMVLLRDHFRGRPRKDFCAVDVIAMEVCIDNVTDRQSGDLAEVVEGGSPRRPTLRG